MAIWSDSLTVSWPTNSSSRDGRSAASALLSSGSASGVVIWSRLTAQPAFAFHRTGLSPGHTTCFAWQETQLSLVTRVPSGTSFRLVTPHLVQSHSAVTDGGAISDPSSLPGGHQLQRAPDQGRGFLGLSAASQSIPDRFLGQGLGITQGSQRPYRVLGDRAPGRRRLRRYLGESVLELEHQALGFLAADPGHGAERRDVP